MSAFFTADTHFCHEKALSFRKEEFGSIEEMNEYIIERWNKTVRPGDVVYHAGDVALCGGDCYKMNLAQECLDRLNGTIYLIAGNHDNQHLLHNFDRVWGVREFKNVVISHIPVHAGQKERFRLNIHGHLHEQRVVLDGGLDGPYNEPDSWYYCVSVEQTDYCPVSWEDIKYYMTEHGHTQRKHS